MLLTSMDIDPKHEADFNRWYDREHLIERVAIDGFLEARRYVAHQGNPKYLCLYSTETFEVLDSPAYRTVLMNPTEWSKTNLARFENMIRTIARITISRGRGRGAALGIIRLRPAAGSHDRLRATLRERLDPEKLDGIIAMHLIEGDAALSKPLTDDPPVSDPGAGDGQLRPDHEQRHTHAADPTRLLDHVHGHRRGLGAGPGASPNPSSSGSPPISVTPMASPSTGCTRLPFAASAR